MKAVLKAHTKSKIKSRAVMSRFSHHKIMTKTNNYLPPVESITDITSVPKLTLTQSTRNHKNNYKKHNGDCLNLMRNNNYTEARFDIWALSKLQSTFIREIKEQNLDNNLATIIIDFERQKLKICRYNLDSNYTYRIVNDGMNIFVHHLWNNCLFDIDHFSQETNNIVYQQSIEYTLANIFDMVINNCIHDVNDINNASVLNIIINTYPHARFNYSYFKYISNNCVINDEFIKRVNARIVLYNLQDK